MNDPLPSKTSQRSARASQFSADKVVIAAVVASLAIAALWYMFTQRQYELRASASGFDGLTVWLNSHRQSAYSFTGGWSLDPNTIGLLVVPVFDTILDKQRKKAQNEKEFLLQQDEYDLSSKPLLNKAQRVPALIVLPKWRSGMRLTQKAHPVLGVELQRLNTLLQKITGRQASVSSSSSAFVDFNYVSADEKKLRARIYAPQTFDTKGCTPIVGRENAMVLAECPLSGHQNHKVLILSDPDLFNNHGLTLGQNAEIARDFFLARADKKNVVIDYSSSIWLKNSNNKVKRERTWADMKRFFGPPFLTLWLAGALLLGLLLWRGSVRYGPIRSEETSLGAKKELAINVRARLMRVSGQDGAILNEYVGARLSAVARSVFGTSHNQHYAGEAGLMRFFKRRNPEGAESLEAAVTEIRNLSAHIPAADAIRHVDEFETILEQLANDT